ncbi:MAG: tRNA (N(6)-L-threonylcarbamoyladenosine(37)-C(2))-methylthiotransferase [Methanomassiliicoccales archaeon]|nr:tRNA (N(6)-L-threonylcarbamoyladenosine(37)-C(2))-methylthiotransferase [Methanomassiliicoccales archaeon]
MKFKVTTYGCTMNQGEGLEMEGKLAALGHEVVRTEEEADVVVANTCDVIDATERKILRYLKVMESGGKGIVITGCIPSIDADGLRTRFPEALVVPVSDYPMFSEVIEGRFGRGKGAVLPEHGPTGIVPIAQGCLGNCAYCITKIARGGLRSYPVDKVIESVRREVKVGAKEILLTTQDTGCYGSEIGASLPELIDRVCEVEGDFKVRVGMMNPDSLSEVLEAMIEAFRQPKVYKFLHLPVQSGSDRLLRSMGRGYGASTFEGQVAMFRAALPRLTLSTDVITGFPGETEEDHMATIEMLKRVRPNIVNVTRFSSRPGTAAAAMKEQVVSRISKDRSREVAKLRFEIAGQLNHDLIGERLSVIATEVGKNGSIVCRDNCYAPIVIRRLLVLGERYDALITESTATHLVGRIL